MATKKESQVVRFPKKYWELFSTLDDAEAGKLIKELLWYDRKIEWMTRIYRDMIKVDLDNMEASAVNWIKGGRPKKEPQGKTQGYWKWKPQVIENENLNEKEIEKEIENETIIKKEIEKYEIWTTRNLFFLRLLENKDLIVYQLDEKSIEAIVNKLWEFREKVWEIKTRIELESFWEHHQSEKTQIKSLILRLNTWLSISLSKK
jgi:hypothetical protein